MRTIYDYNKEIELKNKKIEYTLNKVIPITLIVLFILYYFILICALINLFVLIFSLVLYGIITIGIVIFSDKIYNPTIDKKVLTQCSKFTNTTLDTININEYNLVSSVDVMIDNKKIKIRSTDILSIDKEKRPMKSFVYVQEYEGKDYIAYFVPGHDFYELKEKVEKDIYNPDI